jgi:hypothetical protein
MARRHVEARIEQYRRSKRRSERRVVASKRITNIVLMRIEWREMILAWPRLMLPACEGAT